MTRHAWPVSLTKRPKPRLPGGRWVRVAAVAGIALVAAALVAGAAAWITRTRVPAGTVTAKEYDDPDSWTTLDKIGKAYIPHRHHDPAHYRVTLRNCALRESPGDDCPTEEHDVPAAVWERLAVGDWYDTGERP